MGDMGRLIYEEEVEKMESEKAKVAAQAFLELYEMYKDGGNSESRRQLNNLVESLHFATELPVKMRDVPVLRAIQHFVRRIEGKLPDIEK